MAVAGPLGRAMTRQRVATVAVRRIVAKGKSEHCGRNRHIDWRRILNQIRIFIRDSGCSFVGAIRESLQRQTSADLTLTESNRLDAPKAAS